MSPECYDTLMQYRGLREGIGETVTARSPLIRDAWDNHRYRKQVAKDPKDAKPLTSKTIANMMGQFPQENPPPGSKPLPARGGRQRQLWQPLRVQAGSRVQEVLQDERGARHQDD